MLKYLNNNGTRWTFDNKQDRQIWVEYEKNHMVLLTSLYWKQFGNFASVVFRYKGKRYDELPTDTIDGVSVVNIVDKLNN